MRQECPESRSAALSPEEADESSAIEESEQDSPTSQAESDDLVMTAVIKEDSKLLWRHEIRTAYNPSSWFNNKRKSEQTEDSKQAKVPSLPRENSM